MKATAKKVGLPEREIINRAVSAYLAELNEWGNLRKELRAWDSLSANTIQKHNF